MYSELYFPEFLTAPIGLKPDPIRKLKQLVVLAGPNGAGKTRYLGLVEAIAIWHEVYWHIVEALRSSRDSENSWPFEDADGSEEEDNEGEPLPEPPTLENLHKLAREFEGSFLIEALDKAERFNFIVEKEAQRWLKRLAPFKDLAVSPPGHRLARPVIRLRYSIESTKVQDPGEMAPRQATLLVQANVQGGFESALSSLHAYAFQVARSYFNATHPGLANATHVQEARQDADAFNNVLRALLGDDIKASIDANSNVIPIFRGRIFDPEELSQGEKVLMTWAIMLHRQKAWISGAQVLIDEPENHLHPDVCIKAIEALRDQILGPGGQIWIATHSVPLIAYAGMESVHLVDNGSIQYAGNQIDRVLDRLLGGLNGRDRLRTLMSDASDLAFEEFTAQSLLPPTVVSAKTGDLQQEQMSEAARALGTNKDVVRILDFGAGRGRLAAALQEAGLCANRKFIYYAHDALASESDRIECLEQIRALKQEGAPELYLLDTLDRLRIPDAPKMDLVVMSNVLHEIPVGRWQPILNGLSTVLAKDGHLVILEDQLPSVGELPHANGYVILDELALKALFGSTQSVISLPHRKKGQLTSFAIPRSALTQVTSQSIGRALGMVSRRAKQQIQEIRDRSDKVRDHRLGRQHAHYTLLYANAQLALEEYPEPS